ncbi:hypothetical protein CGRA01v4_04080 [Colletotrichum graminicola]|nr:hypothetical protein CGRA01v4_04080 [Colletotrichum graminicola]
MPYSAIYDSVRAVGPWVVGLAKPLPISSSFVFCQSRQQKSRQKIPWENPGTEKLSITADSTSTMYLCPRHAAAPPTQPYHIVVDPAPSSSGSVPVSGREKVLTRLRNADLQSAYTTDRNLHGPSSDNRFIFPAKASPSPVRGNTIYVEKVACCSHVAPTA